MTTTSMTRHVWSTLLGPLLEQYRVWMIAWSIGGAIFDDIIQKSIKPHHVWKIQ